MNSGPTPPSAVQDNTYATLPLRSSCRILGVRSMQRKRFPVLVIITVALFYCLWKHRSVIPFATDMMTIVFFLGGMLCIASTIVMCFLALGIPAHVQSYCSKQPSTLHPRISMYSDAVVHSVYSTLWYGVTIASSIITIIVNTCVHYPHNSSTILHIVLLCCTSMFLMYALMVSVEVIRKVYMVSTIMNSRTISPRSPRSQRYRRYDRVP